MALKKITVVQEEQNALNKWEAFQQAQQDLKAAKGRLKIAIAELDGVKGHLDTAEKSEVTKAKKLV